ncbi:hypothetical protein BDZ85DRAFT_256950 [Elsinoe ampelina]|uniref:Uncharacterized protein n=1 Tax=Elsinoe ampelina TaxID=302913 RepID=A0A6A6GM96_9PEZI|nr:hypothetical protein BDZ85DRAFT_256950 [Elsinoe ampelina]
MLGKTLLDSQEQSIPHLRPAITAPKRTLLVSSGKWDISAPRRTSEVIPASTSKSFPQTVVTPGVSLLEAIMLESEETSKGAVLDAEYHNQLSAKRKSSSSVPRRTLGTAKDSLLSQTRTCGGSPLIGIAQHPVAEMADLGVLGDGQTHANSLDDPDSQAEIIYRGPPAGSADHDPVAPLLKQKTSSTFMSRRAMSTIERQIVRDARYTADTHDADNEDESGSEDDNTRKDQSSRPRVPPAQVSFDKSDASERRLAKEDSIQLKTPKRRPPRQGSEYAPIRPRPKRQKILQESSMASEIIPVTKTRTKTWSRVLRPRQNAGNEVPLPVQHKRTNTLDSDKQSMGNENIDTNRQGKRPSEQVLGDSCPPWSLHRPIDSGSENEQDIDSCPTWMDAGEQADTNAGSRQRPSRHHPKQPMPQQTSAVIPQKQRPIAVQHAASAESPPTTVRITRDNEPGDEYGGWDGDGGVHGMWSWPDPYA